VLVQAPRVTEYVKFTEPVKPTGGVNTKPEAALPLTPVPANVPPAGLPRSAQGCRLLGQSTVSAATAAVNGLVTVTDWEVCSVQPLKL
jgi:hypothetical protein